MKTIRHLTVLILAGFIAFTGCKEEDPDPLSIVSIEATGTDLQTGNQVNKDLNAATAATAVPVDLIIEVTFDKDVDPLTATEANFSLSGVTCNVTSSGTVVTITPQEDLDKATDYTLSLGAGIVANDGGLFTATTRAFTTGGRKTVTPPEAGSMKFYMDFEGEFSDATGNYSISEVNTPLLTQDRFGYVNAAGMFDGNGNMLDVLDSESLLSHSITVSFWMMISATDTNKIHSFGILGTAGPNGMAFELAGNEDPASDNYTVVKCVTRHHNTKNDGTATSWSNINGKESTKMSLKDQWVGNLTELIDNKWVQVVLTYDADTWDKIIYIDGVMRWHENEGEGFEFPWTYLKYLEPSPEDEPKLNKNWGIGFYGSSTNKLPPWTDYNRGNPEDPRTFSGYLDDIRIWNKALSSTDITQLYNDEKP